MVTILSEVNPVATKHYRCMACAALLECGESDFLPDLTADESEAYQQAKANHFRIVPGQTYYCQNNTDGGTPYAWRAIPAIHAICQRLKMYDYD